MRGILLLVISLFVVGVRSQSVSIEFIDTTSNEKKGEIGYRGGEKSGYLYLGTPGSPEVKIDKGNIETEGSVSAGKYYVGGKELDSVRASGVSDITKGLPDSIVTGSKIVKGAIKDEHIESVSWKKLRDIPAGFADGVDNAGEGGAVDSVRASGIADTVKKLPAELVTESEFGEILNNIKLKNTQIESIDWSKITNIPAGFADGVDNEGQVGVVDSVRAASISDSTKKIPQRSVGSNNILSGAVRDSHIVSVDWNKISSKPSSYPTTIGNVSSLSDSLTAHRNLINSKANSSHTHTISQISELYGLLNQKADTLMYNKNIYFTNKVDTMCVTHNTLKATNDFSIVFNTNPSRYAPLRIVSQSESNNNTSIVSFYNLRTNNNSIGNMELQIWGSGTTFNNCLSLKHDGTNGIISTTKGDIKLQPGSGNVEVTGTISQSSDIRYKRDIEGIDTNTLNKIDTLKGVYFNFKRDEYTDLNLPEGRQIGLIAQDVEKVFPELVYTSPDGYKSIAYDKMTAVLVEVVKYHKQKIKQLENTLKEQKEEIEQIKDELKNIKSVITTK